MEGLQRSTVSFRRQGSSGLVWDDKILSGELNRLANQQKEHKNNNRSPEKQNKEDSTADVMNPSPSAGLAIDRSRSNGGRASRTGRASPAIEPPSPKVSGCGLCSAFGKKSSKTRRRPPKSGKRVM